MAWNSDAQGTFVGTQYRLRAGPPMPKMDGNFAMHTFMAEVNEVTTYLCTEKLPGSSEFRGQGGKYISANFERLNIAGGETFKGKTTNSPSYVEEDKYGFN